MINILIISDGDACRSRIAAGLMLSFGRGMHIVTAGVDPESVVADIVGEVMSERGLEQPVGEPKDVKDIATHMAEQIANGKSRGADYVIALTPDAAATAKKLFTNNKIVNLDFEPRGNSKESIEELAQEMFRSLFRFYKDTLEEELMPACTCGANIYCKCH